MGIIPGGGYAQQVLLHEREVVSVPENLSDTDAAAIPEVFMVAHDALVTHGKLKSGDRVLIHAVAGGLGSAAVQLVKLFGGHAIGTAGSHEKLEAVGKIAEKQEMAKRLGLADGEIEASVNLSAEILKNHNHPAHDPMREGLHELLMTLIGSHFSSLVPEFWKDMLLAMEDAARKNSWNSLAHSLQQASLSIPGTDD